jgi:hypothetical protein
MAISRMDTGTARWLEEIDERGALDGYFRPPLTEDEQDLARREGWILGIG